MNSPSFLNFPRQLSRRFSAVMALCLTVTVHAQTTYQWNGTTDSTFGTAANWTGGTVLPVNGAPTPVFGRLNVFSSANDLTYGAAQGSTIISNGAGRGLVIASGNQGTLNITGGSLSTQGSTNLDVIGNTQTGAGGANLNVSGGTFIGAASGTAMGAGIGPGGAGGPGGIGIVNISGTGLMKVSTLILANLTNCTVNLNGGTLEANNVTNIVYNTSGASYYSATFRFNGGTLKARQNDARFLTLISYTNVPFITPTAVAAAYITNGGAIIDSAGFNITIPTALLAEGPSTGGLTKNGAGLLSLTRTNTYTGATVVNQGGLSMVLPSSSGSLVFAAGTSNNLATSGTNWNLASAALTNTTIGFDFGLFNGNTAAVLNVTNLAISGSVTCNIAGLAIPPTNITLVSYASGPHPGGTFILGSVPSGMVATLNDNGSSVILQVTTGSSQNLIWSASVNNTWQVGGAANWNGGTATYLEAGATGDLVTFNDTAGGTVNVSGTVKPSVMTVSNSSAFHTFSGSGKISGPTGIDKQGTSTLTLSTSNDFTGNVTISGGTVYVDNGGALGATNGTVTVSGPANTLAIGALFGSGVTVAGKSVTITGNGVGGSRGALRGVNANNNVWAGPVIIGGELTRIGAEDSCNLEVAGPISDGGNNYRLLVRPGIGATVKFSGTGSSYGITRTFTTTGIIQLGANNALSTNGLELGPGTFDLNGFNQTVNLLNDDSGLGTILNNGATPATLTINNALVGSQSGAILADGSAVLNLVKSGSLRHTITNASTYTGTTTVNGGDLRVNGTLGNTTITVSSNGTLSGNGSLNGPVIVQAGGTFAPGDGNGLISSLTNTSTLTLNAGSTNLFEIDCATTNADVAAASAVNYGGRLAIIRLGGPIAIGQTFTLFSAGSQSGNFANAASVAIENSGGAVGSFNPATGQLTITALTGVSTTPTNISYVRTGSTVDLSWPASHLGWTIQSNSVGLLATNSWFPIPGSASVTNLSITVSPALTNVFFRMVYP